MVLATIHNNINIIKKDVKNISLKVKPNCEVILTTPLSTTDNHISYILNKREGWINQRLEFYKSSNKPRVKEYVSGESFKYLGKTYRLKIIKSPEEKVKLQRGYIQIFIKNKDNIIRKQNLLNEWYLSKAQLYFKKIISQYSHIINKPINNIKIRQMKTRWGSCNPTKGYINLNSELIKKSKECIEYVIFHELTHLIHTDHNKQFYNFMSVYMPDWKKRKDRLES